LHVENVVNQGEKRVGNSGGRRENGHRGAAEGDRRSPRRRSAEADSADGPGASNEQPPVEKGPRPVRIFPYGIGQNRLRAAANSLNVSLEIVAEINDADIVMTLKNYYRQKPQPIVDAERRSVPVYVLRSNTVTQMEQCLLDIFHLNGPNSEASFDVAMREAQDAIQRLLKGAESAELQPQSAAIRSQQHQLARAANLVSHSYGREPHRRVRIFNQ
jgi:hypothetical protein